MEINRFNHENLRTFSDHLNEELEKLSKLFNIDIKINKIGFSNNSKSADVSIGMKVKETLIIQQDGEEFSSLFERAAYMVVLFHACSADFLMRKLKINEDDAYDLLKELEDNKIIGEWSGSGARKVLVGDHDELKLFLNK